MVLASLLFILKGAGYLLMGKAIYTNYRGDSVFSLVLIPVGLLILYGAFRLRTPHHTRRNRKELRGH